LPAEPGRARRGEALRKLVHIGAGTFSLLLRWLPPWGAWILAGAALMLNVFVLPRATRHALEREGERRGGVAWGIIFYPVSVLLLCIVFARRLEIAAAGWAVMAFGDGCATLAGRAFPRPRLPWNRDKSVAGSAVFLGAGIVAAWGIYRFVAAGHGRVLDPLDALLVIAAAAGLAALVESLSTGIDDNLSVPLVMSVAVFAFEAVDLGVFREQSTVLLERLAWGAGINLVVAGLALRMRSVDRSGFVTGVLVGTAIFVFAGPAGYAILLAFFVLGSGATRIGYAGKAAAGIAQEKGGARGARHAVANCGAALGLSFLAAATPYGPYLVIAFVAAFATAAFDTVASEIGQAYGRHTVMITTLRPARRGTDGAVSLEGTGAGMLASALVALLAWGLDLIPAAGMAPVLAGAFAGAMGESYLGATLQAIKLVDNEVVNFLNTVAGAGVALALIPVFV
jgi:uncharacterized protein (TIGR00297 family)